MTGFPGETEAHFAELCDFVERRRFERLGVFAYCEEPGTHAESLPGAVPEEVKKPRRDELLARAAADRLRLERRPAGTATRRADRP